MKATNKTTTKEVMSAGTTVLVSYKGVRHGILCGTKGGMSFVFADFGEGYVCKRVFASTVKAAGFEVEKGLEKGYKAWCKAHDREFKIVDPITKKAEEPVAKKKTVKAVKVADPKINPALVDIAKGLAMGGLDDARIASVLKALM